MIDRILRLFRAVPGQRPNLPETDNRQDRRVFPENFDALIARRSERVSNRDRITAASYRRIHTILHEGRK
jgi:hypothetical protein